MPEAEEDIYVEVLEDIEGLKWNNTASEVVKAFMD